MSDRKRVLFLLLACIMLIPMVSNDSLWIDEGGTMRFAMQESWDSFSQRLLTYTGSEPQMPLYMILAKVWYGYVGKTEFVLRFMNVLWGVGFLLVGYLMAKRYRWSYFPLFLVVQPFVWFYMNEFRPYVLQMFAGALCLYGVIELQNECCRRGLFCFCLGAVLLVASSLLGSIPLFILSLYVLYILLNKKMLRTFTVMNWLWVAGSVVMVFGLFLFFLYKLKQGGGGSKVWNVSPANIAFSIYEMLGCAGLGFGRDALREVVRNRFNIDAADYIYVALPCLQFAVVGLIGGCYVIMKSARRAMPQFPLLRLSGYFLAGVALLYLLAVVFKWPFWGRHLAPFSIAVFLVLYHVLRSVYTTSRFGKGLVSIFICLLVFSSLSLRFAPRHHKTDYRRACQFAKERAGQQDVVWFVGSDQNFAYYELEDQTGGLLKGIHAVNSATCVTDLPAPDVILYTKPDLFDSRLKVSEYCEQDGFEKQPFDCNGFSLFTE